MYAADQGSNSSGHENLLAESEEEGDIQQGEDSYHSCHESEEEEDGHVGDSDSDDNANRGEEEGTKDQLKSQTQEVDEVLDYNSEENKATSVPMYSEIATLETEAPDKSQEVITSILKTLIAK